MNTAFFFKMVPKQIVENFDGIFVSSCKCKKDTSAFLCYVSSCPKFTFRAKNGPPHSLGHLFLKFSANQMLSYPMKNIALPLHLLIQIKFDFYSRSSSTLDFDEVVICSTSVKL